MKHTRKTDIEAKDQWGFNPLQRAAYYGNAETVTALLEAGADIEAKEKGFTPLHLAALGGHAETVTALLKAGTNGKARTDKGKTPFDLAKDNEKLIGTQALQRLEEAAQ